MVWNILICAYLQICDMLSVPRHDTSACAFTFVTRSNGVTMVSVVFFFSNLSISIDNLFYVLFRPYH